MANLDKGLALARELAHAPTLIHALWYAAETYFLRRDAVSVAMITAEWLPAVSEFGSPVGVANAMMMSGWAKVVLGNAEAGFAELRDGSIDGVRPARRFGGRSASRVWPPRSLKSGRPSRARLL